MYIGRNTQWTQSRPSQKTTTKEKSIYLQHHKLSYFKRLQCETSIWWTCLEVGLHSAGFVIGTSRHRTKAVPSPEMILTRTEYTVADNGRDTCGPPVAISICRIINACCVYIRQFPCSRRYRAATPTRQDARTQLLAISPQMATVRYRRLTLASC
jgi:hypothetical protein